MVKIRIRKQILKILVVSLLILVILYQYRQLNIMKGYTTEISALLNKLEFVIENVSTPILLKTVYNKYKKDIYQHIDNLYQLSISYNNVCTISPEPSYSNEEIYEQIEKLLILQNRDTSDSIYNIFLMLKSINSNIKDCDGQIGSTTNIEFSVINYIIFKIFKTSISKVDSTIIDKVKELLKQNHIKILSLNDQVEEVKKELNNV